MTKKKREDIMDTCKVAAVFGGILLGSILMVNKPWQTAPTVGSIWAMEIYEWEGKPDTYGGVVVKVLAVTKDGESVSVNYLDTDLSKVGSTEFVKSKDTLYSVYKEIEDTRGTK